MMRSRAWVIALVLLWFSGGAQTQSPQPTIGVPAGGSGRPPAGDTVPATQYGWRRYESIDLIQVTGTWHLRTMSNASDAGYHETRTAGATLRYPFVGDGVRIGYRSTPNGAPFHIFIDGQLVTSYQTDYAFFVTHSDEPRRTYTTAPIFISGGYHVLDIVALADGEGQEAVNIDFVEIFTGPPLPAPAVTPTASQTSATHITAIDLLARPPTPVPTRTPPRARIVIVDVFVAVDHNNNDTREPREGVADVPIQVVDVRRNTLLATAVTDASGFVRVQVLSAGDIVLLIPLLSASYTVRAARNADTRPHTWELILDPAQLPGLIP